MAEKKVRVKKNQPLKNHIQTSLNDFEYKAIEKIIMKHGMSKGVRQIIQFALKNGVLKEII